MSDIDHRPLPAKVTDYIIKHAGANQTATHLSGHCSGPACSQPASQPASWYGPTAYGPTDRPIAWAHRSKSL